MSPALEVRNLRSFQVFLKASLQPCFGFYEFGVIRRYSGNLHILLSSLTSPLKECFFLSQLGSSDCSARSKESWNGAVFTVPTADGQLRFYITCKNVQLYVNL